MPGEDCVDRINRVVDHVRKNLDGDLSLERLAKVACFSPFHFHRVFKALTGETLAQFVKRARLERALFLLSHGPRPLTRLALECGFSSSSDFSRSFKAKYGVAPRGLDVEAFRAQRRDAWSAALAAATGQAVPLLPPQENPDGFEVKVVALPARSVRYVRVARSYEPGRVTGAAERLTAWADGHGLGGGAWLGFTWHDPDLVPLEECSYDVGVVVPTDAPAEGEVGRLELPAMRVAEVAVDGGIELEVRAVDHLFRSWLPRSRFVPDAQPTFEAWRGRPFADGLQRFRLKVQLPVVG